MEQKGAGVSFCDLLSSAITPPVTPCTYGATCTLIRCEYIVRTFSLFGFAVAHVDSSGSLPLLQQQYPVMLTTFLCLLRVYPILPLIYAIQNTMCIAPLQTSLQLVSTQCMVHVCVQCDLQQAHSCTLVETDELMVLSRAESH